MKKEQKLNIVIMFLIMYIFFLSIENNILKDKINNSIQMNEKSSLSLNNLQNKLLEKDIYKFWFKN